ncbi:hypothetical protein BCR39DRAFT_543982 [Naematelia encephala]|uniref:FAD-binding domain-containing protein n=1 Tax=Naematelia encephala TaxID=71784 RepID=A0A1Y2ASM2_9TREE|nr:hypothetical protein BCR39DRAFT_543982 [Naematelia encephala]
MSGSDVATPLPVLIVGAGLGGLNLAHALEKHDIPYKIFERDGAQSQRAQGYRISIGGAGVIGLKTALSLELFETFEQSCAEQHRPGGRVDGPTGTLLQAGVLGLIGAGGWGLVWALGSRYFSRRWGNWASWSEWLGSLVSASSRPLALTVVGADKQYQADRRELRSVLLTSQSSHITYDSAFTSYTISPDSVTAHFADGTTATGSILVGADGVRSRVAAQLIGDLAAPRDLGLRLVYGKTPLTSEVEESLHPTLREGVSFVVDTTPDGQRVTLVLESMRFTHAGAPDNYIFWALCSTQEAFGENDAVLLASQGDAAAQISARITNKWDDRIRVIFEKQAVDQTAVLRMTTSNPAGPPMW